MDHDALVSLSLRIKEAQVALYLERERLRVPKDAGVSEWDRQVMSDAAVAELAAEYDHLLRLWNIA